MAFISNSVRRRVSVTGCAVLAGSVLALACSSPDPVEPAFDTTNNIDISRADGSGISFAPNVYAWCGPWEDGEVEDPTVHVIVGGPAARWELRVVRSDLVIGEPLSFPNTFIWNEPAGADMFVYDPPNEASTQTSESTGAIIIEELDCGSDGGVRFTVDAVIGSEFGDLDPVTVTGNFSTPWTSRPGQ